MLDLIRLARAREDERRKYPERKRPFLDAFVRAQRAHFAMAYGLALAAVLLAIAIGVTFLLKVLTSTRPN